jgi:hypothetical protein
MGKNQVGKQEAGSKQAGFDVEKTGYLMSGYEA